MPFTYDKATNRISMPPGDTGTIQVDVDWMTVREGDAVVFAIVSGRTGRDIMLKSAELLLEKDGEGNPVGKAQIRLCNADTRDLRPGRYRWQMRIVTDPARDAEGNVIADECTDNVVSVFSGDAMPEFILEKRGARV